MKKLLEGEIERILTKMPTEGDTVKLRELALTVESLIISYTRIK